MDVKILVVDDEKSMCEFLEVLLEKEDYDVTTTTESLEALEKIKEDDYDLVIADIIMPDMDGVELLSNIEEEAPDTEVIMITAYASLNSAIKALRTGAADYITKPFKVDEIKHSVKRVLENKTLKRENVTLRKKLEEKGEFDELIGSSEAMKEVKEKVRRVAPTDSTVLITGESGTGKELIAKAIHRLSPRSSQAFVSVNCGALPKNLLESEIFGHKKGSFTGATGDKEGLMEVASGGDFFLDEVGETSLSIQVKLLRALEERQVTPIGATEPVKVDVRLIAATNTDLKRKVEEGEFREDLFYRLNVLPIHLLPLRERKDDILPIAHYFIEKFAQEKGVEPPELTEEAKKVFKNARWGGNVRQLQNVIERALVLSDADEISVDLLPDSLKKEVEKEDRKKVAAQIDGDFNLPSIDVIEKAYIYWVLEKTDWNKKKTSEILDINISTLYRKLKKYDLEKEK